ncbi:MAG: hypothetical protein KQH63_11110 [Desulfobulbaceae bacterium]|nr:hypothetical protein [Desulfobulbaceae bacterium]
MERKRFHKTRATSFAAMLLGLICFTNPAQADYLANASFEDPNLLNGQMSLTMPGWEQTGQGSANVFNVPTGRSQLPKPTNGYNVGVLYFYNQYTVAEQAIYQTPIQSLTTNTQYQLTFHVGNPKGRTYLGKWYTTNTNVTVYFVAGDDLDIANAVGDVFSIPVTDIARGTFQEHSISFDTTYFNESLDQPLSIVIQLETTGPVGLSGCYLDYIRMMVTQY